MRLAGVLVAAPEGSGTEVSNAIGAGPVELSRDELGAGAVVVNEKREGMEGNLIDVNVF
jgi:hypothetical protein